MENKKPIYKKAWFWILVVIVMLLVVGGYGDSNNITNGQNNVTENDTNMSGNNNTIAENTTVNSSKQESADDNKEIKTFMDNYFITYGYEIVDFKKKDKQCTYSIKEEGDPLKAKTDAVIDLYVSTAQFVFEDFKSEGIDRYVLKVTVEDKENKENNLMYEVSMTKKTYQKHNWVTLTDSQIYNIFMSDEAIQLKIY